MSGNMLIMSDEGKMKKKEREHHLLLSKYASHCTGCGAEIAVGELIVYFPNKRKGCKVLCKKCGKRYID